MNNSPETPPIFRPNDWCECQHPDHFDSGKDEHTYGAHVKANVTMLSKARFCAKCAAYHPEADRASPRSSLTAPTELKEALDDLVEYVIAWRMHSHRPPTSSPPNEVFAARSKVEEMFKALTDSEALRLREVEAMSRQLYDWNQEIASLRDENERLRLTSATRNGWKLLSRKQQLRVINAMGEATVRAWNLENIHIERMLEAMWDAVDNLRPRRSA